MSTSKLMGARIADALRATNSDVLAGSQSITMNAWENFVSGRNDRVPAVRNVIANSWMRCLGDGVNPRGSAAPLVPCNDIELERQLNCDLLQAASGVLAGAVDLLAGTGSLMLITNADGVVLEAVGDLQTVSAGQEICLGQGGHWKESNAGTNGIGTALAAGQPVLINAAEHYCEGIKKWSCAGAPIRDPIDGTTVGLLDISGLKQTFTLQVLALTTIAARAIERNLEQRTEIEHFHLLAACLDESSKYAEDGLIACDAKGRVLHVSRKAMQLLERQFGPGIVNLRRGTRISNLPGLAELSDCATSLLPELRADWVKPLFVEGKRRGTLLVIPGTSGRRIAGRARPVPHEADPDRADFNCIIGNSPSMQTVIDQARRLAPLSIPVLIEGETGVGKELFARAIHGTSNVAGGPFIPFNCGAVSKEMLASELFGYVRGAFTGASTEGRIGRFELANDGVLCLDEIGELPLDLQPYLLRVLEEGIIYRVGDNTPRRVNVRLLAMTNRNLREEVAAGRFRRDLYYRLSVVNLHVPPLRKRDGDVDQLIAHFSQVMAERYSRDPVQFTAEAMDALRRYAWPGNVREVRNLVERLILLSSEKFAGVEDLPEELREAVAETGSAKPLEGPATLEMTERRVIEAAVAESRGNMTDAARALGISRSTLYRKMSQYQIRQD